MAIKKEFKHEISVPEKIAEIFDTATANYNLRDIYVKIPFGFKKARKCAEIAERNRRKFWNRLYELYPHVNDVKQWEYNPNKRIIKPFSANAQST